MDRFSDNHEAAYIIASNELSYTNVKQLALHIL